MICLIARDLTAVETGTVKNSQPLALSLKLPIDDTFVRSIRQDLSDENLPLRVLSNFFFTTPNQL